MKNIILLINTKEGINKSLFSHYGYIKKIYINPKMYNLTS